MRILKVHTPALNPQIRIVVGPRGWGKTWLANAIGGARPWSKDEKNSNYYCVDVGFNDDAQTAIRYADNLDKWLRTNSPQVQTRVFMRTEVWHSIRATVVHRRMEQQGHVWHMQPVPRIQYGPSYYTINPDRQDWPTVPETEKFKDAYGVVLPELFLKLLPRDQPEDVLAANWVKEQPEWRWLSQALPIEADPRYTKVPVWVAVKRMSAYLDRDPDVWTGGVTRPYDFLSWCETAGAITRVQGPSIQWSPLWLAGCRRLVYQGT